jgi:tRNA splicing ligase
MTYDADRSIDLSFRLLALVWVAGVLCLAAALYMNSEHMDEPCSFAELHFDTCNY